MGIVFMVLIVIAAIYGGAMLAKGSEQETYDSWANTKGTDENIQAWRQNVPTVESYKAWRQMQYNAAITAPPVEEKPWEPIYRECGGCFGSCSLDPAWLALGVMLIASIFGLHFYLA